MSSCWSPAPHRSSETSTGSVAIRTPPSAYASPTSSSMYAVFAVMGPRSRELLQSLSRSDLSSDGFPFATSREIDLGHALVRATRITYVGELGWELYVPVEFAVDVYEMLMSEGEQSRPRARRVLLDQLAAAGEGLPGLRRRSHARTTHLWTRG